MAIHNAEIAALFYRMAELLEIEGANPFRVRAYRRAAATLEDLPQSVAQLIAEGADLDALPAIGEDLAGKIAEVCRTGRLKALEAVEARTPASLAVLSAVPGLGPKRIRTLRDRLGVKDVDDLYRAAKAGRVGALPRFGAAFEARLLKALRRTHAPAEHRVRISTAEDFAAPLKAWLEALPGAGEVTLAGSLRRRRETIGDLDVLVAGGDAPAMIARFTGYEEVAQTVMKGPTRATIVLRSGLQADLRVVPRESQGAALVYLTGSKDHNIALRRLAKARDLKISEYGVFRGETRIAGATEAEVYAAVGLPWIAPELRESRGEIDAAAEGRLPSLVRRSDIRGDLHVHTRASDGKNTLDEMVEAARTLGYDYIAVADHSRHATVAHGLDAGRLAAQIDEIDRLNAGRTGIRVLKACEVDILADGRLDLPNDVLDRLDLVIGAIHSDFGLSAEAQTTRALRAMDNPRLSILAHPTGRLIGERPGYPIDLPRVMTGALERGCMLEINGHPSRLDVDDIHARAAKDMGLKLAIGSDAHSTLGLEAMRHGVDQARRGWLEKADVLNTRPWAQVAALLSR